MRTKLSQNRNSISQTLYCEGIKTCVVGDYEISARAPEAAERQLLECPTYTPILDVRSVRSDDQGLLQYTEGVSPSDRIRYSFTLTDAAMPT
ncbi:MAG: UTRA domain-containing protein [Sphingomonadales bacterium]